ncbi:MAG: hypothetical protein KAX11_09010, partial [Candidatus Aminicenantes bacterium]|nr:hypothetical protein [Candidatus Aminicenantes bacterium]
IFHTPMIDEDSGSLKLWIGEEWIEMGGHQYWIRKYLYSDEKPSETPTLRNIKSAEINLKGLQLVISLNLYF